MKGKSCSECKHFWAESYGNGWNEPRETEYGCNLEDEDEDIIEKYFDQKEVTRCPYYDGGKCEVCGEHIGKRYVFWASGPYNDIKCCSQECWQLKNDEEDVFI